MRAPKRPNEVCVSAHFEKFQSERWILVKFYDIVGPAKLSWGREGQCIIPYPKGLRQGRKIMDASLNRLKARIEKLTKQQHQMEEKYIHAVTHLVRDRTQKGHDLPILTGIILNADQIIKESSNQKEFWQTAGQKFLVRAKHKSFQSKRSASKAKAAHAPT